MTDFYKFPKIDCVTERSACGKFIIHKTIITDVQPVELWLKKQKDGK